MVQQYKSPIRVYKYPFELVMAAYERRFPTCDMIPVLVSTDILRNETSEDGSIEIIERRCKLNIDAPYLLKKMAGVDYFYCIQRNTLNRRTRTLEIEAWNETFSKKIIINEFCTYSVHPENPSWTCFEQSASLEVKSFFGFENAVEKLAVKHYAQSIEKGKEIIEHYIRVLQEEGISSVEVWPDDGASGYTNTTNEGAEESESSRCQSRCESHDCHSGDLNHHESSTEVDHQHQQHETHEDEDRRPSFESRISRSNSGPKDSVKSQVMSKAKNRICFIYNVISDNIQRESVEHTIVRD